MHLRSPALRRLRMRCRGPDPRERAHLQGFNTAENRHVLLVSSAYEGTFAHDRLNLQKGQLRGIFSFERY